MAEEGTSPPGGVKLDKRKKILLGGGAAIAVYLWFRQRNAAAAAAATPADQTAVPGDTSALGMDAGAGPGVYGAQGSAASSSTVGTVGTNQDWFAAALTGAENAGYDAGAASVALSLYLDHQPLTATQQQIVRVGLAAAGAPPVGTFTIITGPTPPASGGGTPSGTVAPLPAPTGLANPSLSTTSFYVSWNGVKGADHYNVYTDGHKSGPWYGTLLDLYTARAGTPINKGTRHTVTVTAVNSAGVESPHSAPITITTKSK